MHGLTIVPQTLNLFNIYNQISRFSTHKSQLRAGRNVANQEAAEERESRHE